MRDIAFRGVHQRRGVEMAVMLLDEPGDCPPESDPLESLGVCFLGMIARALTLLNDTQIFPKANLKLKIKTPANGRFQMNYSRHNGMSGLIFRQLVIRLY